MNVPPFPLLPATMEPHVAAEGEAASARNAEPTAPSAPRVLAERDPGELLARVVGFQRSVAQALRPATPLTLLRPSASRGELDLDRALSGHTRPFDAPLAPGPAKSLALGLLLDLSQSMSLNGIMPSVREVALLVNGAAALADVPCAIFGFTDQAEPLIVRPLSRGRDPQAERRIAGLVGEGGTLMTPAFRQLVGVLASAPVTLKLLIVLIDGDLLSRDAADVRRALAELPHGLVVLPCYVGTDQHIIGHLRDLFGKLLDASDLATLRPKLCAWLRGMAR